MVQIRVLLQLCEIKHLIYFKFHNFQILRSKLGFIWLKVLVVATDSVLDVHIRDEIVPFAHGIVDKYCMLEAHTSSSTIDGRNLHSKVTKKYLSFQ